MHVHFSLWKPHFPAVSIMATRCHYITIYSVREAGRKSSSVKVKYIQNVLVISAVWTLSTHYRLIILWLITSVSSMHNQSPQLSHHHMYN